MATLPFTINPPQPQQDMLGNAEKALHIKAILQSAPVQAQMQQESLKSAQQQNQMEALKIDQAKKQLDQQKQWEAILAKHVAGTPDPAAVSSPPSSGLPPENIDDQPPAPSAPGPVAAPTATGAQPPPATAMPSGTTSPTGQLTPDTYNKAITEGMQKGLWGPVAAFTKQHLDQYKEEQTAAEAANKNHQALAEMGTQILQGVREGDDQGLQDAKRRLVSVGAPQQEVTKLPDTWHDDRTKPMVAQWIASGQKAADFLKSRDAEQQAKTNGIEAYQKSIPTIASQLGLATDPSTAAQITDGFKSVPGMSPRAADDLLKRFNEGFQKGGIEAARSNVANAAITPEKQAERANRPEGMAQATYDDFIAAQGKGVNGKAYPQNHLGYQQYQNDLGIGKQTTINNIKLDAAAKAGGMTEDDFRREGQQLALTGDSPSFGMGGKDMKAKIIHYKNEFARESGLSPRDMAIAKAAFKGDQGAMASLQKQASAVEAFETTASKNLDMFTQLAAKLPDTGIPWLNRPIRDLNEKLVGADYMPAVNAARQVANNEIAKVTSGGGLNSVLSDTARKEFQGVNPPDLTMAQVLHLVPVLKQDMENRKAGFSTALDTIRGRMAGGGQVPPAPQQSPSAPITQAPGKTIDVTDPKGGVHHFPDQAAADKFKKLAGIQ